MCLTDKIFLQTHVTFCEYLVVHEFKRNLYITLAKYLESPRPSVRPIFPGFSAEEI